MQVLQLNLYKLSELSEKAKRVALKNLTESWSTGIWDHFTDEIDAIKEFCQAFGVELKEYDIDSYSFRVATNATNENFRHKTRRSIRRAMPEILGCMQYDLWTAFFREFNQHGSAKRAFDVALKAGFEAWRDGFAYFYSEDYQSEYAEANEVMFTENGSIFGK
jgi:hypothetical protein